jgi:shikimate dehydrogenase
MLGVRMLYLYDPAQERLSALAEMVIDSYPGVEVRQGSDVGLAAADIVVNCTPLGMHRGDPLPFEVDDLKATAVVADLVTSVEITPVLEAASKRGLIIQTGRDMAAAQIDWQLAHLGCD